MIVSFHPLFEAEKNIICAYAWLKLACDQSPKSELMLALQQFGKKLSSGQIAEAEVMASMFSQSYADKPKAMVS